jgi:hypothetical protein
MKKDDNSGIEEKDVIDSLTPNPELDQWKFYAQTTLNTAIEDSKTTDST